jgi:hypothetical protein
MAAAEQLEWRRAFPVRAVRRLGWCVLAGSLAAVSAWVLFGSEPDRLAAGQANPLALVPTVTTTAGAMLAALSGLWLFRRPVVAANHYALRIRPGVARTLVLPWAAIAEIAGWSVRGQPLLLVRCAPGTHSGDRPGWRDRAVLRAALRVDGGRRVVAAYDLAVRMEEFVGTPRAQLASLAAWAPGHVHIADAL